MKSNLKVDLHAIKKQLVDPLSKQLNHYEQRARSLAKEFDLRSRDARQKSRKRVDEFVSHLNQTRGNVEKRVRDLMDQESTRLNKRVTELFNSLKTMARTEATVKRKSAAGKASTKKKKKTSTRKKKTARKK